MRNFRAFFYFFWGDHLRSMFCWLSLACNSLKWHSGALSDRWRIQYCVPLRAQYPKTSFSIEGADLVGRAPSAPRGTCRNAPPPKCALRDGGFYFQRMKGIRIASNQFHQTIIPSWNRVNYLSLKEIQMVRFDQIKHRCLLCYICSFKRLNDLWLVKQTPGMAVSGYRRCPNQCANFHENRGGRRSTAKNYLWLCS